MKMKMKMGFAAVGMAAALTAAAMTEAISYRGRIGLPDGKPFGSVQMMPMTFRVYDSANPKVALWARQVPVSVERDGSFYVDLSDSSGVRVGTNETSLARVCALARGYAEIGLTLSGSQEFSVRQVLRPYARAERARFAVSAPTATFKNTLSTKIVNVGGDVIMPGGLLKLSKNAEPALAGKKVYVANLPDELVVGGTNRQVVLHGGVTGWGSLNEKDRDRVGVKARAQTGVINQTPLTCRTPETVFLPAGTEAGADVTSVQSF